MRLSLYSPLQLPRPWGPEDEARLLQDTLAQIEVADRVGLYRAWVPEHHFLEEFSHSSAPAVLLAAAASRTSRVRLGLAGVPTPPAYGHPAAVAAQVATLDLLSRGRVDLATTETSAGAELGGFGVDRATVRHQWAEGLEVLARMLGEEPFAGHSGRELTVPPRNVVPRPQQRPHPPLWLACPTPEHIRLAAENGLGALCTALLEPDEAAEWVAEYRAIVGSDRCVPVGAGVEPRVALVLPLMVHAEEAEAIDRGIDGAHLHAYARAHHDVFGDHRPGRTDVHAEFLARREQVGFSREAIRADGAPLTVRVVDAGRTSVRGAVGTPDQVRELLGRYADAGVDEVAAVVATGRIPHAHVVEALELLGETVVPAFHADADAAEAAGDAELGPAVGAALARRRPAPVADPDHAISPRESGGRSAPADDAPSAGDHDTAGDAGTPGAGSPSPRRRGVARPARVAALRGVGATRGAAALGTLVRRSDDRRLERTVGSDRGLRIVFSAMAARFDPVGAAGFTGDIRFMLTGGDGRVRTWTVTCRLDGAVARPTSEGEAAVVLRLGLADFVRVAAGELDPGRALLTGQLDLEGDFAVASRLGAMFVAPG